MEKVNLIFYEILRVTLSKIVLILQKKLTIFKDFLEKCIVASLIAFSALLSLK